MRRTIGLLVILVMLGGINQTAAAKGAAPVTVWKDPAGDADMGQQTGYSVPGGFDLVSGAIARNKNNLEFTITHADMPPNGSLPEAFRFMWAFSIGAKVYRLTIKSMDVGKPDPSQGQTDERVGRVDTEGHFRLEGDCGSNVVVFATFINCKPLGYMDGKWDVAAKSVQMIVPMKLIKAKTGTLITAGAGDATQFCQICWGSHIAERSPNATLIDGAIQSDTYKVPR